MMDSNQRKLWGIGLIVLIPLSIIGLVFTLFISMKIYRMFNPYLDREISGAVTLTSDWLEIAPQEPLRPEREVQQVMLDIEKPVRPQKNSWGLVLQDGSIVTPEVQLVDEHGNTYSLTEPSFNTNPSTGMTLRGFSIRNLPQDRRYSKVRIHSDKPIKLSRVIWRCYDPQDRK